MLEQASEERDITDFKEAVQILVKAAPAYTYPELEKGFRKRGFKVFLIAMVGCQSTNSYNTKLR
jgi:hypothetical protein